MQLDTVHIPLNAIDVVKVPLVACGESALGDMWLITQITCQGCHTIDGWSYHQYNTYIHIQVCYEVEGKHHWVYVTVISGVNR